MKKIIVALFAMVLVLSSSLAAFAEEKVKPVPANYTATKTVEAVTVDGLMDEAYEKAEVIEFEKKQAIDLLYYFEDSEVEVTANMRVLYDDNYIYAFITVNDPTYAPGYKEKSWWNNVDSVWLGFAGTDCYAFSRATTEFWAIAAAPTQIEVAVQNMNGEDKVDWVPTENTSTSGYYDKTVNMVGSAVTHYNVEVKIPYSCKTGESVLFGAFVCDDVDFVNTNVLNYVEGRTRTSNAVATDSSWGDNGIWQLSVEEVKTSDYFDVLTFVEETEKQTEAPTEEKTEAPTEAKTDAPTEAKTDAPTEAKTDAPTEAKTDAPTEAKTDAPTEMKTEAPTEKQTEAPTVDPEPANTGIIIICVLAGLAVAAVVVIILLKKKK